MTRRAPENRLTGNLRRISRRRTLWRELQDTAAEDESARVAKRRPVIRLPKAAVHDEQQRVERTHWLNWRERPQPVIEHAGPVFPKADVRVANERAGRYAGPRPEGDRRRRQRRGGV